MMTTSTIATAATVPAADPQNRSDGVICTSCWLRCSVTVAAPALAFEDTVIPASCWHPEGQENSTSTAPQLSQPQAVELTCLSELDEVVCSAQQPLTVLAHIKAPVYVSEERQTRAPVVITAVLDRSGSMGGPKLALLKQTMAFVTQHLKPEDELAVVSFDDTVKLELPLTRMSETGRARAAGVISALKEGGSTNLAGGLFEGITQVTTPRSSSTTSASSVVTSVWVFTDGQANSGVTDAAAIKAEAESRLAKVSSAVSVFTFGFGGDVNSSLLREVAQAGSGLFYHLETEDQIPGAFADCLGGLLSVAAQNLHLTVTTLGGVGEKESPSVTLRKVRTAYKHELSEDLRCAVVHIPDLYSEEARDILLELEVLPHEPHDDARGILTLALQYFNVPRCTQESVICTCELRRPTTVAPGSISRPVPAELDTQRNRFTCADALVEARRLSEADQLPDARAALTRAISAIEGSVTGGSAYCRSLVADLRTCMGRMQDRVEYATVGAHYSSMCSASHYAQRSVRSGAGDSYRTSNKARLCSDSQTLP